MRKDSKETLFLAITPTYDEVEAWYIHDCPMAYSLSGITDILNEAITYWPYASKSGLYVLVLLVVTKLTRENPIWGTCTIN